MKKFKQLTLLAVIAMFFSCNIYRHAMFTVETQVDATHYQRYFSGGGTTLLVSIRSVETVPGI